VAIIGGGMIGNLRGDDRPSVGASRVIVSELLEGGGSALRAAGST